MKVHNTEKLSELHEILADHFLGLLKDPKTRSTLCAADLSAMIRFLKDNGIESAPVPEAKTSQIAKILPFPDGQDEMSEAVGG